MEQVDVVYSNCKICSKPENNHTCKVCNLDGMTHLEFYDHTFTKEHEKKCNEQHYASLMCHSCQTQFESVKSLERHKKTKMHIQGRLTEKDLFCQKCKTQCANRKKWEEHLKTNKHLSLPPKTEVELYCLKCHTQCHNERQWNADILTTKHISEPFTKKYCEKCDVTLNCKSTWDSHCKTKKHNKLVE
jgi:hypothetical protein